MCSHQIITGPLQIYRGNSKYTVQFKIILYLRGLHFLFSMDLGQLVCSLTTWNEPCQRTIKKAKRPVNETLVSMEKKKSICWEVCELLLEVAAVASGNQVQRGKQCRSSSPFKATPSFRPAFFWSLAWFKDKIWTGRLWFVWDWHLRHILFSVTSYRDRSTGKTSLKSKTVIRVVWSLSFWLIRIADTNTDPIIWNLDHV